MRENILHTFTGDLTWSDYEKRVFCMGFDCNMQEKQNVIELEQFQIFSKKSMCGDFVCVCVVCLYLCVYVCVCVLHEIMGVK